MIIVSSCPSPYPIGGLVNLLDFKNLADCRNYLKKSKIILQKGGEKIDTKISKGKNVQYIPKSEDDRHGVTHGSLVQAEKTYEAETISHFLKKYE